jgi:hypothetical protein
LKKSIADLVTDYTDQQDFVANNAPGATVHNNDYVGIASYNIFVGVYVATIFGSAFFFDLFWPKRKESRAVKLAWKICSILACLFTLSAALAYTVIVATRSAHVTGTDAGTASSLLREFKKQIPLKYRENARAVASVVFLWPGMIATFARYIHSPRIPRCLLTRNSTYLLWRSLKYIDANGPKSKEARMRDDITAKAGEPIPLEDTPTAPAPTHN